MYTLLIITITLLIEYLDESSGSKERSSYESKGKYVQELNIIMMAVFTGLTLPPVIKRRGRPKGHTLTVVGLVPKKKRKKYSKAKPTCFSKMHHSLKEKGKLSFIN